MPVWILDLRRSGTHKIGLNVFSLTKWERLKYHSEEDYILQMGSLSSSDQIEDVLLELLFNSHRRSTEPHPDKDIHLHSVVRLSLLKSDNRKELSKKGRSYLILSMN